LGTAFKGKILLAGIAEDDHKEGSYDLGRGGKPTKIVYK
jgi:hypothetical protein